MDNDKANTKPSEMSSADLPDVRAFNDEFTLDFLQSAEETRAGYYQFISGTGAYEMDFPAGGVIGEKAYVQKEKEYEEYPIHIKNENGTGSTININYYSYHKSDKSKSYLDNLEHRLGTDVAFQKEDGEQQLLFYTYFERNGFQTYAGYVQNKEGNGGIDVVYQTDCMGSQEKVCTESKVADKDRIIQWMKSIKFLGGDAR